MAVDPGAVPDQHLAAQRHPPVLPGPHAASHGHHLRIGEDGQRGDEVAGLDPGVGVEQHHHREPADQAEPADSLLQRPGLAYVLLGLDHPRAGAPGDLDRGVGGSVGHHVDVVPGHQGHDGPQALLEDEGLVVRRDEHRHVARGQWRRDRRGNGQRVAGRASVRRDGHHCSPLPRASQPGASPPRASRPLPGGRAPASCQPTRAPPRRRPASDSASRTRPTVPQSAKLAPSTKISSTHQGIMTPPTRC